MKVKRWAYDHIDESFYSVPDGNWVDFDLHVSQMRELKSKLKSRPVWLLYIVDFDNRSGEEFFHAFNGKPNYEQFCQAMHILPEQYERLMKEEEVTISGVRFFMRAQV